MKTEIKSFLWVPSAYNDPGVPAYQIDVVDTAETMEEVQLLGGLTRTRLGLNVDQAVNEEIDLTIISEKINTEALLINEQLMRDLEETKETISNLRNEIEQLKKSNEDAHGSSFDE